MNDASEFEEQFEKLREAYQNKLVVQLDDLLRLYNEYRTEAGPEQLEEIKRLSHVLAGSGATFGYQDLGASARLLEKLCESLGPGASDEPHLRQMGTLVGQIIAQGAPGRSAPLLHADAPYPERPPVFLIDADRPLAETLSEHLSFFGYSVLLFSSPRDFLQKRGEPALPAAAAIIIDTLFLETAAEDVSRIREAAAMSDESGPPLLFLSGLDDFHARLGAIRAGGEGFFRKPVDIHSLVDRLDSATRRHLSEPFRVLIVDDDLVLARHHALILEEQGIVARTLEEEKDFLNATEEFQPDLILMDLYLKDYDGFTLARIIEQHDRFFTTPVVFLSTEINIQKRFQAFEAGGENFLTKPIAPENLVRSVFFRAKRARKARRLRTRDSLTGLLNFAAIEELLRERLAEAGAAGTSLGVALIDIDFFKKVNDTYGHAAGDRVLQTFGRLLRERFRAPDAAGRHGGEEFLVLLPGADVSIVADCMAEVKNQFQRIEFPVEDGSRFRCTLSCGVVEGRRFASPPALLSAVDEALYEAKNTGRDKIVIARNDHDQELI